MTKIENHSLNLDRESFDLNDMISQLVVEYTSRIKRTENGNGEGKDVKLIHLRNKEIIVVNADRERLNQVISNLLSNAMKFTKEGTISISEQKRIESKDGVQEEEVIVMVNDTGSGIDKEIMAKLFSKFTTKSQQETGLGLYISKKRHTMARYGLKIILMERKEPHLHLASLYQQPFRAWFVLGWLRNRTRTIETLDKIKSQL